VFIKAWSSWYESPTQIAKMLSSSIVHGKQFLLPLRIPWNGLWVWRSTISSACPPSHLVLYILGLPIFSSVSLAFLPEAIIRSSRSVSGFPSRHLAPCDNSAEQYQSTRVRIFYRQNFHARTRRGFALSTLEPSYGFFTIKWGRHAVVVRITVTPFPSSKHPTHILFNACFLLPVLFSGGSSFVKDEVKRRCS
jgi:hypothetical protein